MKIELWTGTGGLWVSAGTRNLFFPGMLHDTTTAAGRLFSKIKLTADEEEALCEGLPVFLEPNTPAASSVASAVASIVSEDIGGAST